MIPQWNNHQRETLCSLSRAFIIIIYLNLYTSNCCGTLNYFCSFVWSEHAACSAYFPIGRWHFHWTMNLLWHNKFSWMFLKMCHKVNILCLLQLYQHCPLLPAVIWISSVCNLSSKILPASPCLCLITEKSHHAVRWNKGRVPLPHPLLYPFHGEGSDPELLMDQRSPSDFSQIF